jgi:uncharacterized membrane protein (DUF106 family)
LCIVLGVISKVLQRKFIDKREMDYNREKMKELQKKMNELMKIGSEKSKKELELLQTEMLEVNSKILNQSMKLMWVTMPVFLIAFAGMNYLYGGKSLESFVALPMFEGFNMLNPMSWIPVGLETSGIGFFKMYFFYYLVISLVINLVEKIYDKKIKPNIKK